MAAMLSRLGASQSIPIAIAISIWMETIRNPNQAFQATLNSAQEFFNPNRQRLEGSYLFPLPHGAHIDKFAMDIDGRATAAELLPADKARQIYEDIVRQMKDPALLEYVGRGAFKARIYPLEPRSKKRVSLSYTQLLAGDSELLEYVYPLNTEKFSAAPVGEISVKVTRRSPGSAGK
jgi:Ca-activated chloride channel homolog